PGLPGWLGWRFFDFCSNHLICGFLSLCRLAGTRLAGRLGWLFGFSRRFGSFRCNSNRFNNLNNFGLGSDDFGCSSFNSGLGLYRQNRRVADEFRIRNLATAHLVFTTVLASAATATTALLAAIIFAQSGIRPRFRSFIAFIRIVFGIFGGSIVLSGLFAVVAILAATTATTATTLAVAFL